MTETSHLTAEEIIRLHIEHSKIPVNRQDLMTRLGIYRADGMPNSVADLDIILEKLESDGFIKDSKAPIIRLKWS